MQMYDVAMFITISFIDGKCFLYNHFKMQKIKATSIIKSIMHTRILIKTSIEDKIVVIDVVSSKWILAVIVAATDLLVAVVVYKIAAAVVFLVEE